MKIPALAFTVTDWSGVAPVVHPGETGHALWRTLDIGDLRVRMVEYSPGYLADHFGISMAFLGLALAAVGAFVLVLALLPETKPASE